MTSSQKALYFREWAAVRKADPEADRHALHQQALGKDKSSKAFTNADLDKVLAAFRAISRNAELQPQLDALNQPRQRLLHLILHDQAAQLAALEKEQPLNYIFGVCADKFNGRTPSQLSADSREPIPPSPEPRPSELQMLLFTIARAISELRQARGWTQHDLNVAAGLHCACAPCARARRHINNQRQRAKVSPPQKTAEAAYAGAADSNNPF